MKALVVVYVGIALALPRAASTQEVLQPNNEVPDSQALKDRSQASKGDKKSKEDPENSPVPEFSDEEKVLLRTLLAQSAQNEEKEKAYSARFNQLVNGEIRMRELIYGEFCSPGFIARQNLNNEEAKRFAGAVDTSTARTENNFKDKTVKGKVDYHFQNNATPGRISVSRAHTSNTVARVAAAIDGSLDGVAAGATIAPIAMLRHQKTGYTKGRMILDGWTITVANLEDRSTRFGTGWAFRRTWIPEEADYKVAIRELLCVKKVKKGKSQAGGMSQDAESTHQTSSPTKKEEKASYVDVDPGKIMELDAELRASERHFSSICSVWEPVFFDYLDRTRKKVTQLMNLDKKYCSDECFDTKRDFDRVQKAVLACNPNPSVIINHITQNFSPAKELSLAVTDLDLGIESMEPPSDIAANGIASDDDARLAFARLKKRTDKARKELADALLKAQFIELGKKAIPWYVASAWKRGSVSFAIDGTIDLFPRVFGFKPLEKDETGESPVEKDKSGTVKDWRVKASAKLRKARVELVPAVGLGQAVTPGMEADDKGILYVEPTMTFSFVIGSLDEEKLIKNGDVRLSKDNELVPHWTIGLEASAKLGVDSSSRPDFQESNLQDIRFEAYGHFSLERARAFALGFPYEGGSFYRRKTKRPSQLL